ncbi:MAG: hypothetical protein JWO33_2314 [Caulobacteraceae bacterium]|nr:hypothetical protein [Caulobacteraceae bacterium]
MMDTGMCVMKSAGATLPIDINPMPLAVAASVPVKPAKATRKKR